MFKEESNFYKTIFRNSKDALLILKNRVFIDCNEAALNMIGYTNISEILSLQFSDLSPTYQEDGRASVEKAREMLDFTPISGSHKFEWVYKKYDGSILPVEITLTELTTGMDNEIICIRWRDLTETKEATQNNLNSKSRLRSLIELSPFIIEIYNMDGLLLKVNKAYENFWGIKGEVTEHKFNILRSNEIKDMGLYDAILKAYKGEAVNVPTYKFKPWGVTKEAGHNKSLWLNTTIYPLKDATGEVARIVVSHEDVTERYNILKELQFSEDRFRSMVETTNDFIWEMDSEFRYQYVSPQVKKIFGIEATDFIGRTPFDIIYKKERDLAKSSFSKYIMKKAPFERIENINVHKDGHLLTIESSGVPFFNSKGKFSGYRGIDRDISNTKIYEKQLLLIDSIFKNSIEGIIITDSEGVIQKVNSSFSVITGYSSEEAIGENPRLLKSEKHEAKFYADMWASLKNTDNWSGEIWNRKKNGTVYPERLSISAIHNQLGDTINYISVFHDISDEKLKQEKMEFLAFHDPLTKLPNRRLFNDRLYIAIESAKRLGLSLALYYMDIDNFKDINDTYGHPFGDDFLCAVKDRINTICRKSDTFARYGGDEFTILLNGISSEENALEFSNKIINLFSKPLLVKNEFVFTSLSIGFTIFPGDGEDIDSLLKAVDLALYKAKKNGKRQSFQYKKELHELALQKNVLNNGLRMSVEDFSSFYLVYQPKIDISTMKIYGVEALIRWNLNGSHVPPSDFIPLAEESNLIIPLGRWILKQAMKDIKEVHNIGLSDLSLSINLSTRQFRDENLFGSINDAIKQTGFNKHQIIFEVTEGSFIKDVDNAILIMDELKSQGFSLSIDDFGTGYSSLSYLSKLPLNELKIDKSFVDNIPHNKNDNTICKTIINMAKNLNYKVVAEGVENHEQLLFLKDNGCHIIQGYYFYKPMSISSLKKIARETLNKIDNK